MHQNGAHEPVKFTNEISTLNMHRLLCLVRNGLHEYQVSMCYGCHGITGVQRGPFIQLLKKLAGRYLRRVQPPPQQHLGHGM